MEIEGLFGVKVRETDTNLNLESGEIKLFRKLCFDSVIKFCQKSPYSGRDCQVIKKVLI